MPYRWRLDGNLLRSEAFGVFRAAEARQFLEEAAIAERARGIAAHRLSDFRRVTEFAMDHNDVRDLAKRRTAVAVKAGTKAAMLTRNSLQYGMVRMFQTLLEDSGILVAIFSDDAAALAWLADQTMDPPPASVALS